MNNQSFDLDVRSLTNAICKVEADKCGDECV